MRSSFVALVAAGLAAPCFAQGLMGTTLDYNYFFPDQSTNHEGPTPTLITAATEQFVSAIGFGATIDITDSQLILTVDISSGTGWSFTPGAFNGMIYIDSTNNLGTITSVTIDPASTMPGLTNDRIVWTADSFGYNFQGLNFSGGDTFILNIVTPTPGAAAALGLAGVASLRRRRR